MSDLESIAHDVKIYKPLLNNKNLKEGFKMDKLENVSIIKKANIYFEGRVTSRTVLLTGGERKTLGIMMSVLLALLPMPKLFT